MCRRAPRPHADSRVLREVAAQQSCERTTRHQIAWLLDLCLLQYPQLVSQQREMEK
jgi:hypothetical protein